MRIAVIGAGNVGGTLGRRWATLGHDVVFGVPDPARSAAVKGGATVDEALPSSASVTTVAEAVRGADVVLLATPWAAVDAALRAAGAMDGAVLIDATNPVGAGVRIDPAIGGSSGGEHVQSLAPRARVVKAFNTTGWENMRDPRYATGDATMFVAGDDPGAKAVVRVLAAALGFDPVDVGGLSRARELEHLAILWISLAAGAGVPAMGRNFAFRLMHR